MADRFSELVSFLRVAEAGSLSQAAARLGLSLPVVSRRLSQLEARLGVTLVRRNSRHLSLTEEGEMFFSQAGRAMADMERAESVVRARASGAAGTLKVATTLAFGRRRLGELLQRFARQHVDVTVHLDSVPALANPVESGHDLVISFAPPPLSSLICRRLGSNPRLLCAAPSYLERRGRPRAVADLARHDHVVVLDEAGAVLRAGLPESLALPAGLATNDADVARAWALDGAGIALHSLWEVADDLESGALEAVLPEVELPALPVVALFEPRQGRMPRLRSCLQFLAHQVPALA
jgi:DNA-binding transcriptional LysR family regulator